jgi:hypothetical protein
MLTKVFLVNLGLDFHFAQMIETTFQFMVPCFHNNTQYIC